MAKLHFVLHPSSSEMRYLGKSDLLTCEHKDEKRWNIIHIQIIQPLDRLIVLIHPSLDIPSLAIFKILSFLSY